MIIQNSLISSEFLKNFYVSNKTLKKAQKMSCLFKITLNCENFQKFGRKIKSSITNYLERSNHYSGFSTGRVLPIIYKDVLPIFQQCNLVYEYVCHCDSRWLGRTSQRLQDRIRQHVPKSIWNRTGQERKQPERQGKSANSIPHCDWAIGNHLLHSQKCASH